MLKIRRPLGRLIFNMGIAIPGKTVFLIETAPRWSATMGLSYWLCTVPLNKFFPRWGEISTTYTNSMWRNDRNCTSDIRCTLIDIVGHSDVVVGTAPTASSFSTKHLASIYCTKTTARRDEKHLSLGLGATYIRDLAVYCYVFSVQWLIMMQINMISVSV